jgi:murein DD-endopeptidase MepM/ murein hydrolase activator NlpD
LAADHKTALYQPTIDGQPTIITAELATVVYNIYFPCEVHMNPEALVNKVQFAFMMTLIVFSLFVLAHFVHALATTTPTFDNADTSSEYTSLSDDPNAVTAGMATAAQKIGQASETTARTISLSVQATGTAVIGTVEAIGKGMATVVRGIGTGIVFVARTIGTGVAMVVRTTGNSIVFVATMPVKAFSAVTETPAVQRVLRPSDFAEVPIIDPNSPELRAAIAALPPAPPAQAASPASPVGPAWPINGEITTYFGVPHWPYQPTHSGIDISDGKPSGITPVKPFRPGRVVETIQSNRGLGNHVIVDHGSGITSVYAHLYSISVTVGQEATLDTVLGLEGSTGLSTGPHLHFEVRVNGKAADPREFISGHP